VVSLLSVVEANVAAASFANVSPSFLSSGLSAYDGGVKQIPCVCGYVVRGEDDDELWKNAQEHLGEDHPDLAGKVSREDLLAQAEEVPRPK
jgi:predicted small metal-binding protein